MGNAPASPKSRKTMIGKVVSDGMDKTVVVAVERKYNHPTFGKVVKTSKKYKVHDERNECKVGDVIQMCECRPLSKQKRWRLTEVTKKAVTAEVKGKK
ncbi:MAG: 30S ribosomal protein S17 [Nitrospinota bacterium]|nr:30S ribosomal protein S17 [Nitrospinota bacterium]